MNKTTENNLNRAIVLHDFLIQKKTIWKPNLPIEHVLNEILIGIKAIQSFNVESNKIIKSLEDNKTLIKKVMIGKALHIQAAIIAYASSVDDLVLFETVGFPKSKMEVGNDNKIYDLCSLIYDVSLPLKPELINFTITESDYDNLYSCIIEFGSMIRAPRGIMNENSNFKSKINSEIKKINYLIACKLHYYLLPYRLIEPEFYNAVKNLTIINYFEEQNKNENILVKGKTLNFESWSHLQNVHLWVESEENIITISSQEGKFELFLKNEGTYVFVAEKEGFYQCMECIDVEEGNTYELNFELEPMVGNYINKKLSMNHEN